MYEILHKNLVKMQAVNDCHFRVHNLANAITRTTQNKS